MRIGRRHVPFPVLCDFQKENGGGVSQSATPQESLEVDVENIAAELPQIAPTWDHFRAFFHVNMGAKSFESLGMTPSEHIRFLQEALLFASKQDSTLPDPAPTIERLKAVIIISEDTDDEFLLTSLENKKKIDLSAGYEGRPGHAVWIHLQMIGEDQVEGYVVQTGEGIDYHGTVRKSKGRYRTQYAPKLLLGVTPLAKLREKPLFFQQLAQLRRLSLAKTANIHQFYADGLVHWPGAITVDQDFPTKGGQRGPTCSMKVFLRILEEDYGHCYPKIKFYLRVYSICGLLCRSINPSFASCVKLALSKTRNTLLKMHQQNLLPHLPRMRRLLLTLTDRVDQVSRASYLSRQIGYSGKQNILAHDFRVPQPLSRIKWPIIRALEWDDLRPTYSLDDLHALRTKLKSLPNKETAGRYALHVLSGLPPGNDWNVSGIDYASFAPWIKKLIEAIRPDNEGRIILTPRYHATLQNLQRGFLKIADQNSGLWHRKWILDLFIDYTYQVHSDKYLLHIHFRSPEKDVNDPWIQAILEEFPHLTAEQAVQYDLALSTKFHVPLQLSLLIFLTEHACLAHKEPLLTACYRTQKNAFGDSHIHYVLLQGLKKVANIRGIAWYSYFPWSDREIEFLNVLHTSENPNRVVLEAQEGTFFGGAFLNWEEIYLLRSIIDAPFPRLPEFFDYLRFYPHRLYESPFRALCELLLDRILQTKMSVLTEQPPVSQWIIEFFDHQISNALEDSLLGHACFFLRLFAKLQVHYPTTSKTWIAHLDRVLQAFIPDATIQDPLQGEEQRLSFYYQMIALVPYLPHVSQRTSAVSKKLAQLLAFNPGSGLSSYVGLLQEDFAKGCDLLQNPALHKDRQITTLPLSLLQHNRYPFKDRCPNVTFTQPSPEERVYHFTDSDGASALIHHFVNTSEVRFAKVIDNHLVHLCLSLSDYQNPIHDLDYGYAWLMDRTKLSFWQSDDLKTIYIMDKISHRTMAIWRDQYIYHPSEPLIFVGLNILTNHSALLCLDKATYTLPWSFKDSIFLLERVEYPRLGLSFQRKGKYYYENLPPYRQFIDHTVPELELWQHYIVVQDKDGLQSVLVPEGIPKRRICVEDISTPKPCLEYSQSPRVFCYPLNSVGEVLPSQDTYADLWLIALMLWQGHYEKAYRLTTSYLQHPRLWSKEECALLLPSSLFYPSLLEASYNSPQGILSAIRIRLVLAAYPFDQDLETSLLPLVSKDYTNYLDQLNSVEGLLRLDEEGRMLRLCRKQGIYRLPLRQRGKDLFQYYRSPVAPSPMPGPPPIPTNLAFPSSTDSFEVPKDLSSLTEQDIIQHRQQLTAWVKSLPEEERQPFCSILDRLIFSSNPLAALSAASLHHAASSEVALLAPDDERVYSHLQLLRNRAIHKLPCRVRIEKAPSHSVRVPLFRPNGFILGHLPPLQLDDVVDIGALLFPLQGRGIVPISSQLTLRRLEKIYMCYTQEGCINHIFEEKQASIRAFQCSQNRRHPIYDACHLEDKKTFEEVQSSLDLHLQTLQDMTHKARVALEVELQTRYSKDALDHRLPFPLTLEEVIAYLVREKYYDLVACFPSLEDDLAHFRQQVASYLMLATELQHLQRAKKALSSFQEAQDPLSRQQAREEFLQVISLKRQYHHHQEESFTYLAVEWLTGKRLFSRQIKMVCDLSDLKKPRRNAVAETGFGKSSVVIPIVLLLLSKRPLTIPVMTLPHSLLEDEIRLLKGLLGTLGLSVYHVDFDRKRAQDVDQVRRLRDAMEGAKETLFIMSMSTAQIISDLALKTDLLQNSSSPLRDELIKLRNLWTDSVYNFVDESRELLGADEHIYAVGNRQPISWAHRTRATTFYRDILLHENILSKWHFSFLPHDDRHKKEVSEETYDELKDDLLLLMIDLFSQQDSRCSTHEARQFLQGRDNSYLEYDDDLRYWKNQLNTYLPTTLKAKYGSRYQRDLSEGSYLAIPCAAGVPRPSYEFACLDELVNFTVQVNLIEPLSPTFVHEFITTMASKIPSGEVSQKDRATLKDLLKSALLEQGVRTHQELLAFTQHLNGHLPDKLRFISIAVLCKIAPYSHKIASTSHTFVLSHQTHGASATATIHALPPVMTLRPRPKAGIRNLLSLLEKDAQIFLVTYYQAHEFLEASLRQGTHHVLIDQAGLFSQLEVEAIQKIIFQHRPSCQHLLFYDAAGTLRIWNRGDAGAKKLPELPDLGKTFIYLAESKAVGTDLPMLPDAKLLITLDWRITQARLEQSLGRGRRLHKGQSADFVIGEKHWFMILDYIKKEKIRADHALGNLLRYAACQEGLQGSLEVYQSLYRHAQALLEKQIFDAPAHAWESLVLNFSNLLTLPTEPENPILPERKRLSQYEAIRQVRHSFFTPFYETRKRLSRPLRSYISFKELESQWEDYVKRRRGQLTHHLHTQTLNAGQEQIVCAQVESQRQTHSMTNQHRRNRINFPPKLPRFDLLQTLSIFDFKIKFTASFSHVAQYEQAEANKLFKKPAYNYLLKIDSTKTICLAVVAGPKELSSALEKGYFYLKDHRVLAIPPKQMDASFPDLFSLVKNPIQAQQILILAKLFRREKNLSPQDWELLKKTKTTQALIDWAKATLDLALIPRQES